MTQQAGIWKDVDVSAPLRGDAKDVARRRVRRASERDVHIPDIVDPARRAGCRLHLLRFLVTYLALLFPKRFSWDHLRMIHRLQVCILRGRRYVIAAPRGSGKSTIVIGAVIWALLYGHRNFLVILCGNHINSTSRLNSIRMIIETNPLLMDDFPAPCACVRALEGAWNRANAQTVAGGRTYIKWGGADMLVFPTIEGEPSSGACIATRSMKTGIRGINYTGADGAMRRPDIVLFDDPIEKEQAESETIVDSREDKIKRDALQLAGPGVSIAAVMLITVIRDGDLASRFLDPARYPMWFRIRSKTMHAMPDDMDLWEEYHDLRIRSQRRHKDTRLCDAFYKRRRKALDAGARPAWTQNFEEEEGELSATQHAMNVYFDEGPDVFLAEYQNEPPITDAHISLVLDAYRVERALSGLDRGIAPNNTIALTLGGDVNKFGIHWTLIAAAPGRICTVVDYGVQEIDAPTGRIEPDDTRKLQALELAILGGLRRLRDKIAEEPFQREDGQTAALTLGLLDSRWMGHVVDTFCIEAAPRFFPAMGCGTTPHMPTFRPPKGAQLSRDGNLYVKFEPVTDDKGRVIGQRRRFMAHADAYKQMLHAGFFLEPAEPGCVRLFKPKHRKDHHTFAHHLIAELQIEKAPGVFTWEKVRGRADNHYLDATYLALCALSILEHRIPSLAITGTPEDPEPQIPHAKKLQITEVEI